MKSYRKQKQKIIIFVKTKTTNNMKGISYITDDKNHKKAVVIDLKAIEEREEEVLEFIDVLIAESRKGDEQISWEEAKRQLKRKGKL